jgi:hypothetical protein
MPVFFDAPFGQLELPGWRPKCDRCIDLAYTGEIVGKQLYCPLGRILRCNVWATFVEICLERCHTEYLIGSGRSYPVRAAGSGRDERREPDFGLFEICCLKTSAADLASSGVISASVPEAEMLWMWALEIVAAEFESPLLLRAC